MAAAQTDLSIKENQDLSPDFANGPPLPIDDWPDNPLLLCVHPRHKSFIHTNYDDQIAIPFNKVFDLESKAFKGKAILRVIDMPTTDKSYFKGRRRKTDFTSQGVFKRRIRFDHVFTGQIYDRPFRHLPTPYLISTGLKIVQALAPSLKADIDCDNPHLMSPWASACQVFNICKPGDEVPLPAEPSENLELLDSKFKGMSFTDRKALFHDFNELSKYYFEPGYVYTMSFYTHMFSPMQYCLHMLKMKWGIQSYMPCPMVANAIILPEDDDVAMISDSCDKLIGDTKINDKLIEEILKEKSASVDNDNDNDSGNNSNSKIENDKINTNTNTNDQNDNSKSNNNGNKKSNNNNNNNDDDSNGTSSDDIPNPGRDRNPAVDNNTQENNDDKNKNKNKDKEQTNNNNNSNTNNNQNNNNSNNNSNNNEKDNNSDTDEKKGNHHKSVSEMTIDEKIDVMQSDSRDLLDCDMIYSFNIWHVKLVDELYNGKYSIHQKGTNSNSNSNDNNNNNNNDNSGKTRSESFSLFGSKKKSSMDNNTGQSKSHDLPNSGNNGNSGNGSENVDDNNSNDTSDGSKSKSILGSMFGKRWS